MYENHWTAETLVCRGLILDRDGEVVARPFRKFFNYGDPQAKDIPSEPFEVMEKIDGSLGILYYLEGLPYIATRSSFTSRQAIEASAMVREQDLERIEGVTPLFEIVYPGNRIVVDYGDRRDLILLAAICNQTGNDLPLPRYSGSLAHRYGQIDLERLAGMERPNREGFVVVFESGYRLKVKFPEYRRLHKILTGVSERMIWESMRDGDDLDSLLAGLPDEIYAWISQTRERLRQEFDQQWTSATGVFERRPSVSDRKTLAQYFIQSEANAAVLFRMLDGKPFEDLIWKAIRPEQLTLNIGDVGADAREPEIVPGDWAT